MRHELSPPDFWPQGTRPDGPDDREVTSEALRLDLELVAAWAHLALAIRDGDPGWIRRAQVGVGAIRLAQHKRQRAGADPSPLARLALQLGLSPRERAILLCVAAPRLDDDVVELYAELGGGPDCTPTMIDRLLGGIAAEELAATLDPAAPLGRLELVAHDRATPWPRRALVPGPRLAAVLDLEPSCPTSSCSSPTISVTYPPPASTAAARPASRR